MCGYKQLQLSKLTAQHEKFEECTQAIVSECSPYSNLLFPHRPVSTWKIYSLTSVMADCSFASWRSYLERKLAMWDEES